MLKTSYILNSAKPLEYLIEALSALQPIKRADEEFVVVYAGNEDCSQLQSENPWVDLWIVEKDQGEAHGLNKGILATRGTVIRLLTDEDEFIIPVFHEAIDLCLEDNVDAVFVAGKSVDEGGREWPHPGRMEDILNFENTCGLSLCYRRSIIPLVGLLDSRYISNDVDFICRLIRSGVEIRAIDKIGFIRQHNRDSNAVKFRNRTISERKLTILDNSGLSFGTNVVYSSTINDILNDRDYAKWLGSYIDKGLLYFSSFESDKGLLSEKILEVETRLTAAKEALKKQNVKSAESALHFSLEGAVELPGVFSTLVSDLYSVRCQLNQAKDDLTDMEKAFGRAMAEDPQNPDSMSGLGDVCLDAERYKEAADYFRLVVLKEPDDATAYMGLALAAKQLNDEQTFTMAYERLCALDPSKSELMGFKQSDKAAVEGT